MTQTHSSPRPSLRSGVLRLPFFAQLRTLPALLLTILCAAVIAAPVTAQTSVSVGHGCDYPTIQQAVDAMTALGAVDPADAVIRVTRGVFAAQSHQLAQQVVIDGGALTLEGGYYTCTGNAFGVHTYVGGNGAAAVLRVTGAADVVLRRLDVSNGGGTNSGGIQVDSDSTALLDDVQSYGNNGRGLFLFRGSAVLRDTVIRANHGGIGGGIYCQLGTLRGVGGNLVAGNEAITGGGLASLSCDVELEGSFVFDENEARWGGGIYASSSRLTLRSTSAGRVELLDNAALDVGAGGGPSGGALYLDDTDALLVDVYATANAAFAMGPYSGGGVLAMHGGTVRVTSAGMGCPAPCSLWERNHSQLGSAVYMTTGRLEILGTTIREHTHFDDLLASSQLVYSITGGAELHIEGSSIVDNLGESVIDLRDDSVVTVVDSTFSFNSPFETFSLRAGDSDLFPTVGVYNSILFEESPTTFPLDPQGTVLADCIVAGEDATRPPSTTTWLVVDPLFVDPHSGDFHLGESSPAVDACPPSATAHVPRLYGADVDGEARCVSDPQATTTASCDLGADEIRSHPAGLVFADGFESGDVAAWSP